MAESLENKSYTPALVIFLIIAAFIIGTLYTKVQYLEGPSTPKSTAPNTTAQVTPQPSTKPLAGKIKPVTDKDHIRGNKNAKVTLVEYSDLECPYCKQFHPTVKELLQTYEGKIRFVYRHYPLPFHQNAQKEAEASECVAELGGNDAFWNFIDKIFERTTSNGTGFALDKLGPLAKEVGVDQGKFQSCLDSGKYTKLVEDQQNDGTTAGVNGTPATFVIYGSYSQLMVGAQPASAFKTVIDKALSDKSNLE